MFSCPLCDAGSPEECKCDPKDVKIFELEAKVKMVDGANDGWRKLNIELEEKLSAMADKLEDSESEANRLKGDLEVADADRDLKDKARNEAEQKGGAAAYRADKLKEALRIRIDVFQDLGRRIANSEESPVAMVDASELAGALLDAVTKGEEALAFCDKSDEEILKRGKEG